MAAYAAAPALVACLALLLLLAAPARGQNLLFNPRADENAEGWSGSFWSPRDADGEIESGSLAATATCRPESTSCGRPIWQCVGVQQAATYLVGGDLLIPEEDSETDGFVELVGRWYAGADCTGSLSAFDLPPVTEAGTTWSSFLDEVVAPATARSAFFGFQIRNTSPPGIFWAHGDNLLFVPEPGAGAAAGLAILLALVRARGRQRCSAAIG